MISVLGLVRCSSSRKNRIGPHIRYGHNILSRTIYYRMSASNVHISHLVLGAYCRTSRLPVVATYAHVDSSFGHLFAWHHCRI